MKQLATMDSEEELKHAQCYVMDILLIPEHIILELATKDITEREREREMCAS